MLHVVLLGKPTKKKNGEKPAKKPNQKTVLSQIQMKKDHKKNTKYTHGS